jgi:hypothetical protein
MTSPRPSPWFFRKTKYSRRDSRKISPMAAPAHAALMPAHRSYDGNTNNLFFAASRRALLDIFIIKRAIPLEIFLFKKVFERNAPVTKQHTKPTILPRRQRCGVASVAGGSFETMKR